MKYLQNTKDIVNDSSKDSVNDNVYVLTRRDRRMLFYDPTYVPYIPPVIKAKIASKKFNYEPLKSNLDNQMDKQIKTSLYDMLCASISKKMGNKLHIRIYKRLSR